MKRKKKNRPAAFTLDASASWSLVKVSPDGTEQVLASGLTLDHAATLAERHLADCGPGETVSLREAPVWSESLRALFA